MSLYPMVLRESAVAVATNSTAVLAANVGRRLLTLQNDSNTAIYVNLSGGTAVANTGLYLAPGGAAVYDVADHVPTQAITAIHGGSGSKTLLVGEGV